MTASHLISCALLASALALTLAGCRDREAEQAQRDFDKRMEERHSANLAMAAENARIERDTVRLLLGESVLPLWDKCHSTTPPKQPENQRACQTLIDRVHKKEKALDAQQAREDAKW
jgi:hypothetical protein